MTRFPLGFWNYVNAADQDASAVADWDDCGMTLTMSPNYQAGESDRNQFISLLDEAHRRNIGIILRDSRTNWKGAAADPEGYRARFRAALADLGSHPAVFGFHIGDEPNQHTKDDAVTALRIANEEDPNHTSFLNQNPYNAAIEAWVGAKDHYRQFLVDFSREGGAKLLCYDCYYQMNPGDAGVEQYFTNLNVFSQAAKELGIPLWTTLLSVGHFRYRCPSEDDIRWQLYTALASGCKGILWFYFYMVNVVNYRLSPIDEHGKRTPTFDSLSRVQQTFLKREGQVMPKLKVTKVAHINRAYGGYELFLKGQDELLDWVTLTDDMPAIATWYVHEDGSRYFSLVNNSQRESAQVKITFKGEHALYRQDFGPKEQDLLHGGPGGDSRYAMENGKTTVDTWLAPGQMVLYRVE